MTSVGLTPRRSEVAEDIRDFESGTDHACRLCRRIRPFAGQRCETIEWAHDRTDHVGGHVRVELGRVDLGVSERSRSIMRSFYVIESQSPAEQDWLLAGAARHSAHDTRQHPRL